MTEPPSDSDASKRRVHPRVAVTLLGTIRSQDRPREVFEAEDPAVTMPRRLGLSDAVKRQIDRYEAAARKRDRLSDEEFHNLVRLAIRRPDSQEVFLRTGRSLGEGEGSRVGRAMPRAVGLALARRRVRRLLKANFGRNLGGFARGAFTFEGRSLPFIQADPGGDACALVTGLCEAALDHYLSEDVVVSHVACQALGADVCRWRTADGRIEGTVRVESEGPGE